MIRLTVSGHSAARWAPWVGCVLWTAVSGGLTAAGARQIPTSGIPLALMLYAAGLLPGTVALRRLAGENRRMLASAPSVIPVWKAFVPRFWLMMFAMMIVGQALRLLPVHPWIRAAFYLPSASALLVGALAFLMQAISLWHDDRREKLRAVQDGRLVEGMHPSKSDV
jgi:hypothetical protein